jgi:hypothetical protein
MDHRITKMRHKLNDVDLATELVKIGLDTPKKIKAERNLVKHLGKKKADKVRAVFPYVKPKAR